MYKILLRSTLAVLAVFALSSVTFAQKATKPDFASAPVPGTYKYSISIEMGAQTIDLENEREVEFVDNTIVLTDKSSTPFGSMESMSVVEKETLLPISQDISQGFFAVNVKYSAEKIEGEMEMQGATTPINIDKKEDAYLADVVIANLPLKEGYETSFNVFSAQPQELGMKLMTVKVVGKETVETSAGSFETYKCEFISEEDGKVVQTLWVNDAAPKTVIKMSADLPQGGGMSMEFLGYDEPEKEDDDDKKKGKKKKSKKKDKTN